MLGRLFRSTLQPEAGPWAEFDWLRERDAQFQAALGCIQLLSSAAGAEAAVRSMAERLIENSRHLRLIWFWHGTAESDLIKPQVACGPAREYVDSLALSRAAVVKMGTALRMLAGPDEHARAVAAPQFSPWQITNAQYGFRSALAAPLRTADGARQGLAVAYADKADYFDRVGADAVLALARLGELSMQLEQLQQVVQAAANADPLTSLLNRRGMQERLLKVLEQHHTELQTQPRRSHLLLIDIDYFKQVNEYYGHEAGDRLIVEISRLLAQNLRQNDLLSRWGGQEFLVVLAHQTEDIVKQVAERLRVAVAQHPFRVGDDELQASVSIGVAPFDKELNSPESWVNRAVAAMQRAKQQGRNRVCWA
jgi:diguanylate cyclase (GGDEF)-like protein